MRVAAEGAQRALLTVVLVLAAALTLANGSAAQSLTPMRGEITSFSDRFAVRVYPANPYHHRIRIEVRVYDEAFAPVEAEVLPPAATLAPSDFRSVLVLVPFDGRSERKIRICAESVPFDAAATRLRTQVCGRFLAHRAR